MVVVGQVTEEDGEGGESVSEARPKWHRLQSVLAA
jgi:hypothetical protein